MMLEYTDVAERPSRSGPSQASADGGLEVEISAMFAHADEDMPRSNDAKTAAVHFLRFRLDDAMREQLRERGATTRCRPFALRPRADRAPRSRTLAAV